MCGIAGIVARELLSDGSTGTVERMISLLRHRGPDGTGMYRDPDAVLGHARLSIIDLAGGAQPIHNEDQTVWVVFNGEIFNYVELRGELERQGHRFYTHSDTEVIVHLYEQHGERFPCLLNGQFAIALWDRRMKKLLLVRDRPGILPLFYSFDNRGLVFASEIKSVLSGLGVSPRLDPVGLDQLFTFWSPVAPRTLFHGVAQVPPGSLAVYQNGRFDVRAYWDWEFFKEEDQRPVAPESEVAAQLHELLVDATRLRLRSDVPVAAYLSGGLDSSVLVSLIHRYGGVPLRTFSIEFEDARLDESKYQRQLIDHLGAEHSAVRCGPTDISANFESGIWHTESAILRTAPIPMGMLSRLVREQGYKVVLTGEGSDEVFGGYDLFKEAKIRQFWARNTDSRWRPLLLKRLYPYLDLSKTQGQSYLSSFFGEGIRQPSVAHFSHIPRWTTTAKIKDFFSEGFRETITGDPVELLLESFPDPMRQWHPFHRAQYIEAKTLMAGYILAAQGDRMLMMSSVEGRFPFLDHRVIEFANRLSPRLKMRVLREKYILKQAMRSYVPQAILDRYKQPYRAPDIPSFFSGGIPEYVSDALSWDAVAQAGYFDPKKVALLMKKIQLGRAIGAKDNMAFLGILSTQVLHRLFVSQYHLRMAGPIDSVMPAGRAIT